MIVARLNYLALDRPDIQYATKEASNHMTKPKEHHWGLLKRIARYTIDAPRAVQCLRWHTQVTTAVGMSDFDWAGDRPTRKFTSGGLCRMGPYVIKALSSTQMMIALSSAEAELYALLKCVCQTLGILNLASNLGLTLTAIVHTDASVALAIAQWQGLSKLRHIDAHWLWIQERVRQKELSTVRILGKDNPADLMTKHLTGEEIHKHLRCMDFVIEEPRNLLLLIVLKTAEKDVNGSVASGKTSAESTP